MTLCAARHLLETVSVIAAAVAIPGAAFPQTSSAPREATEQIKEDIRVALESGGPRSAELIVPLTELGVLYASLGQHILSTAALEEARAVVRANYGLHTLDQLPLMQQELANHLALGDIEMVQALEEELLALAKRYPNDLRTVAIHRDIADRRMGVLRRVIADQYPPEVYGTGIYSIMRSAVVSDLVTGAQIQYADAAAVLLRNGLYSSDELRALETDIVQGSDVFRQRNGKPTTHSVVLPMATGSWVSDVIQGDDSKPSTPLQERANTLWDLVGHDAPDESDERRQRVRQMDTRYELGRESYRRLIAYNDIASSRSPDDEATRRSLFDAYLQLADWDLLYSENKVALDEYAQIREMLGSADGAEPLLAEIFAPRIPVALPTFLPNPLDTRSSARYVDVAFEVTRFGEGRHVEIRGSSSDVADDAKSKLVNLVKSTRFRPRTIDGELARAAPVVVRYYLSD